MFQKIANFEKKIKAKKALKNKRKEAHKLNELNFLTRKNEINSSSFSDEVGIVDEVTTEPTATEKIIAKTANVQEYTYYTNSTKVHGVIAINAKKLGIGKLEFPQSKFGRLDYYLKFEGNTNQANKLMEENWDSFKNYIHKSPRKNTKIWSKQ
jgi:hypothetical protein